MKLMVDIAKVDWPHFYPDFFPQMLQLIHTQVKVWTNFNSPQIPSLISVRVFGLKFSFKMFSLVYLVFELYSLGVHTLCLFPIFKHLLYIFISLGNYFRMVYVSIRLFVK